MDGAGIVLCFVDFECRCVETENGAKAAANRGRVFELDGVSCFFLCLTPHLHLVVMVSNVPNLRASTQPKLVFVSFGG